jgi:hypothetical protein
MATRRIAPGYLLSLATALAVGIVLIILALPRTAAGLAELHGRLTILAFVSWSKLDRETRAAAGTQFAFAAISERSHASAIVRRALRYHPEILAKFDRAVKHHKES